MISLSPDILGGIVHGRVKSKGPLRCWNKNERTGETFSFIIVDHSASIQVVAFGKTLSDLYQSVTVDSCYEITGFEIKSVNPQYKVTDHDHEIHLSKVIPLPKPHHKSSLYHCLQGTSTLPTFFGQISRVVPIEDKDLPEIASNCVILAELASLDLNSTVDILAIVYHVGPLQTVHCITGEIKPKITVRIVDDSLTTVHVTAWGDHAEKLEEMLGSCVRLTNITLRDFQSRKSLVTTGATKVTEAAGEDATILREWWTNDGHRSLFTQ